METILTILSIIVGIIGIFVAVASGKGVKDEEAGGCASSIIYIIGIFVVGGGIYAITKNPIAGIVGGFFWPFVLIVWGLVQLFKILG